MAHFASSVCGTSSPPMEPSVFRVVVWQPYYLRRASVLSLSGPAAYTCRPGRLRLIFAAYPLAMHVAIKKLILSAHCITDFTNITKHH